MALTLIVFALAFLLSASPAMHGSDASPMKAIDCSLWAQDDTPPEAVAGEDIEAYVGIAVEFNGSESSDDVGIESYTWTIEDTVWVNLTGVTVQHVFNSEGVFNVTLNVTDAEGNWDSDTLLVQVAEDVTPPSARQGYAKTISVNEQYELNGSLSRDYETGIVSWEWTITKDNSTIATLEGVVAYYTFEETGTYEIELTVTNGVGLTNSKIITLTVITPPNWLERNWVAVLIVCVIGGLSAVVIQKRVKKNNGKLLNSTEVEKLRMRYKDMIRIWKLFKANRLGFLGFIVLCIFIGMAILAPVLATVKDPTNPVNQEPSPGYSNPAPPSFDPSPFTGFVHPFGTDSIGEDVYSLTLYGARASLMVGFVATFISVVLGVTVGLLSGYFGKAVDEVLMRFTDYFLVLPWFPLMIVCMTVLGREFHWVIVVIGITSWPSTARIVRSQVLTVKERVFIERARAIGSGDLHIIQKHVFPNVLPLVFANTVLLISLAIFSEAFLDFFGLGDPYVISWGTMLELAYSFGAFDSGSWWWVLPPSLSIILCVLAFSLVGYALDDIFNPKLRKR
jgi:peptide/nickel transport system permease protein